MSLEHFDKIIRSGQTPTLHIIVLFGENKKVIRYVAEIIDKFLQQGIDVYCQSSEGDKQITPQMLPKLLHASKHDFIAVIGARDESNNTMHMSIAAELVQKKYHKVLRYIQRVGSYPNISDKIVSLSSLQLEKLSEIYLSMKYPDINDSDCLGKLEEIRRLQSQLVVCNRDVLGKQLESCEKKLTINIQLKSRLERYTEQMIAANFNKESEMVTNSNKETEKIIAHTSSKEPTKIVADVYNKEPTTTAFSIKDSENMRISTQLPITRPNITRYYQPVIIQNTHIEWNLCAFSPYKYPREDHWMYGYF